VDPATLAVGTALLTVTLGVALATWLRYRSVLRARRRIAVRLAGIGAMADGPREGPIGG
jgi:hypothetical protein